VKPEEIRDLGNLAGDAIGGGASRIYEMHDGIANRVFGVIGPLAAPVRLIHDGITRAGYQAVSRGLAVGVRAGAGGLSVAQPAHSPSIGETPAGRAALGALNGAFGDLLVERGNSLALGMTLRAGARDIPISREALARAYPDPKPRLAVLLHGLCENDEAWRIGAERHVPYGERLRAELGYTPLYVRYNSGRHISTNGRELARLLDDVVARWPVEVTEIALIGHSMGALVARSACHYGAENGWVSRVRHVFMLGAPHRGAPLERITNSASAALERLPETRIFAKALNLRSAGVKDLRYGYLTDGDWARDAGSERTSHPSGHGSEIAFLAGANHYFVSATVTREPDAPAGRLFGDLLVLRASAWAHGGRGERMRFPLDNYRHVGGINHFDLLNHPAVYEQINRWLGSGRMLEAAVAS
jgi:pimeloyl-ACP methyl ester carboxylesterase